MTDEQIVRRCYFEVRKIEVSDVFVTVNLIDDTIQAYPKNKCDSPKRY